MPQGSRPQGLPSLPLLHNARVMQTFPGPPFPPPLRQLRQPSARPSAPQGAPYPCRCSALRHAPCKRAAWTRAVAPVPENKRPKTFPLAACSATVLDMRTVIDAAEFRLGRKDLPPKKRVWGFREPARSRIRKSASQVVEPRRENHPIPMTIASGLCYYLSTDPIGIRGGDLNLYAYVAGNPSSAFDPYGLDTYRQDRYINTRVPTHSYISHTFVFTTNPNGSLNHTYSWGNSYDANGNGRWEKDLTIDRVAAQKAIDNPDLRGPRVGDASLDSRVDAIYEQWRVDPASSRRHPNGGITENCKTEADRLIDAARESQDSLVAW